MTAVAVFIPVLARPHRVEPLLASLMDAAGKGHEYAPYFICSPSDTDEIAEVRRQGWANLFVVDWEPGRGDYAKKMNYAWRHTEEEWVFLAADDLVFHPGWFEAALAVHEQLNPCVIGTNDLGNTRVVAGLASTHTLVNRAYGDCGSIDDPTVLLHEGYWHNFVDDEFVQTAMWRETYAHAHESHVEHLHPNWEKAAHDSTYAKGEARFRDDGELYHRRAPLWGGAQRVRPAARAVARRR